MAVNKVRRNGSYAPLSAHYYKDDAIQEAGEKAEVLFTRGMAFCADVLSDGFISDRQLRIVGVGLSAVTTRAAALVRVGLWRRDDDRGGYWLVSWLKWNRSKHEIEELAEKDAGRKRRAESERNPNGGSKRVNGSTPVDNRKISALPASNPTRSETYQPVTQATDACGKPRDLREHAEFRTDSEPRARPPRHDTTRQGGNARVLPPPEPPRKCLRHANDPNPPACGPCGDARRQHAEWEAERNERQRRWDACPQHRGQPAHNCGLCRADQLAGETA